MKRRILKSMTIVMVLSMILTFALMLFLLYTQSHSQMEEVVETEAGYVKVAIEDMGEDYLTAETSRVSPSRITLIAEDGEVIYDSAEEATSMENHSNRKEFLEALDGGTGRDTRFSMTLGEETFYYATRLDNGEVLRIARTTTSVFATVKDCIVPLVLIFMVVLIVAILITRRQTEHLVKPLNNLDLEHPLDNEVYEEISPLLGRIHQQNQQIDRQLDILEEKQEEYQAITENMEDGLIVTDQSAILSINKKALELFQATRQDCLHKNILTMSRNQELKESLELALQGRANDRIVELEGRDYQIRANPVQVEHKIRGAVIFLLDVTNRNRSEAMRREFTANVSHELKTPLMSISGYAELMMNNMVKAHNIQDFAGRIYEEANRLSNLVTDIIKLSRLDEQDGDLPMEEQVDMWSLANDVVWQLTQKAASRGIAVKVEGKPTEIKGNSQILREIIYNLCDNAIKYNVENGKVIVHMHPEEQGALISVEDTGIGISAKEQDRIFERFYRVDKSRSQDVEGTGLGLSIVKHGIALHGGTILLNSIPGDGTKVTVRLP